MSNFGEPIYLNTMCWTSNTPTGKKSNAAVPGAKLPWVVNTVDTLANQIVTRINSAAVANPITLLSLALLSTPKQAMDEEKLVEQLDLYRNCC
jgi:glycerol-3-phosphate O-acyltransferase